MSPPGGGAGDGALSRTLRVPRAISSSAVRHMKRSEGVLILLLTLACWSSVPLFLKHLAGYIDHWTNNGWRYGASALFWLPPAVLWAVARGTLPRAIWVAALVPALANTLSQVAFTAAHSDVDRASAPSACGCSWSSSPSARTCSSHRARHHPFAALLIGIALLVGGIGTVLFGGDVDLTGTSLRGVLLSIASGMGYGVYGLAVRKFMYGYHPVYAFGVIAMYTAAGLLAGMLAFGHERGMDVLQLDSRELWDLGLSAFLGIALGHVLYYTSIDRLGVATTAGVLQLQPFMVDIASAALFGEVLHALQWTGGIVAVVGAAFIMAAQKAAERARSRALRDASAQ